MAKDAIEKDIFDGWGAVKSTEEAEKYLMMSNTEKSETMRAVDLLKAESAKHKRKMLEIAEDIEEEYTEKGGPGSGRRAGSGSSGQAAGGASGASGGASGSGASAASAPAGSSGGGSAGASLGSGYGTGNAIGAGLATPGGTAAPTASAAQQAASGTLNRVTKKSCAHCGTEKCNHNEDMDMEKAITSRSMAIPFYMRPGVQGYDRDGVRRSATQQTSRMYSSISPPVRQTIEHVKEREETDPRINAMKSGENYTQDINKLRHEMAKKSMQTGKDPRWMK